MRVQYSHRKLDIIITMYPEALEFVLKDCRDVLPHVPILALQLPKSFEGIETDRPIIGHASTVLFLGLGTGLGSALMVRGHIVPMELGALSYGKGTIEDYLGARGLRKLGKRKWRKTVEWAVIRFVSALLLDDVVIGGGNAKKLKKAPPGCRLGSNANAFLGGFRMWDKSGGQQPSHQPGTRNDRKTSKGA
jgi:hypothetical protein